MMHLGGVNYRLQSACVAITGSCRDMSFTMSIDNFQAAEVGRQSVHVR